MLAPTLPSYSLPTRSPAALRAFAFALLCPSPAVAIPCDIANSLGAHRLRVRSVLLDIANDLELRGGVLEVEIGSESGLSVEVVRDVLMLAAA